MMRNTPSPQAPRRLSWNQDEHDDESREPRNAGRMLELVRMAAARPSRRCLATRKSMNKSPHILEHVMTSVTFEASDQREVFWYNEEQEVIAVWPLHDADKTKPRSFEQPFKDLRHFPCLPMIITGQVVKRD